MYNRYIPASGGGYVCRRVEEPAKRAHSPAEPRHEPEPVAETTARAVEAAAYRPRRGFLQRLFPKGLELDDVLILLILLLLLIDGDDEDTLSILLTAAAFLILQ